MKGYMTGGITDISPVINSYTDALLDVFPQVRLDVDDKKADILSCKFVGSSRTKLKHDIRVVDIKFLQDRYQPMDLYFKTRVWIAHHLPEIVYELLYIGHAKR